MAFVLLEHIFRFLVVLFVLKPFRPLQIIAGLWGVE